MEKIKQNTAFLLAVILAFSMCSMPAYAAEQAADAFFNPQYTSDVVSQVHTAGTWNYDAVTDTWTYSDVEEFKNRWGYIVNPWNDNKPAWFIFDENGKMLTGWQLIYWDGSYKYFYFHEASDGRRGECQLGGVTPDGYTVDKNGVWTVRGEVQQYSSSNTPSLMASDVANGTIIVIRHLIGVNSTAYHVIPLEPLCTNETATVYYDIPYILHASSAD